MKALGALAHPGRATGEVASEQTPGRSLAPTRTMVRSRTRPVFHVLQRVALAMAGAAGGLFVGAQAGTSIEVFSQGLLLSMMFAGAIGFYFGMDRAKTDQNVVYVEVLTSVGTFLATLTAFMSVGLIVLYQDDPHIFWTTSIVTAWTIGVLMQIASGAVARRRG